MLMLRFDIVVVTALDTLDRGSFISVCEDAPLHSAPGHDPVANGIGGEVWNGREGFATSVLGCGEKALRAVVMVFGEMLHLSVYRTISITLAQNSFRIFNLNAQVCYFSLSMIYGTKNTGSKQPDDAFRSIMMYRADHMSTVYSHQLAPHNYNQVKSWCNIMDHRKRRLQGSPSKDLKDETKWPGELFLFDPAG